ncbi:hypothetical protein KAR34_05370 [bacterium]|nr:hypothetical protein [bacterium]
MLKKIGLLLFVIQIFLITGIMGGISQVNAQNLSQELTDEEFLEVDDEIINLFLDDMVQIFLSGEITQVNVQNLSPEITDEEFSEVDDKISNSFLGDMITKLLIIEKEMDQKQANLNFASK